MKIKNDPRKLIAISVLGISLWASSALIYLVMEGAGRTIWTTFFAIVGAVYIVIGLSVKSRFRLTNEHLEISDIAGLVRRKILLKEIKKVKFNTKKIPTDTNNLLMLILRDKKFKSVKQLELFSEKGRIGRIDGHFIDDKDFEKLKRKLK